MSLFGKKTQNSKKTTPVLEKAIKPIAKTATVSKAALGKTVSKAALHVVQPLVTEKAMSLSENNTYVFLIDPKTNKSEIKKEIEGLYKVEVVNVNISKYEQKAKHYRGLASIPKMLKKAMVTVKEGQKIEIYNK
jgi:large subunit ribosomal protein L23